MTRWQWSPRNMRRPRRAASNNDATGARQSPEDNADRNGVGWSIVCAVVDCPGAVPVGCAASGSGAGYVSADDRRQGRNAVAAGFVVYEFRQPEGDARFD